MLIDIVEANQSMCEEISNLLVRSISELCFKDHQNNAADLELWLQNKTPKNVKAWLEINQTYCAVSKAGTILGVIQISTDNRILLNYVDPSYSKIGIGTQLLRRLEIDIVEGEQILVESTETAKPFYTKMGFAPVGQEPNEMFKLVSQA